MSLARTSLMTLLIVMAANLRLTQTFTARQPQAAAAHDTQAAARAAALTGTPPDP
jgi:hypothetical protein